MRQIATDIWTVPSPLTFMGLKLNTRMTLCRLSDGGLAIFSPVPCSEDVKAAVDALGTVRVIVAPNLLHHLYVGEWIAAYPEALSYAPRGLEDKRPELTITHWLDSDAEVLINSGRLSSSPRGA